jgi:hypothetical protein
MALNHRSIAVEGVGYGHKALSILGFKWFTVDYVPPVIIESYGGGGSGISSPAKLIISVMVNGKWKRNEYEVTNFAASIEFIIKQINRLKLSAKYIGSALAKVLPKASINSIEPLQHKIKVEPSKVEFKVRRKK